MTEHYLRNTTPDYITGAVSACEGIRDSLVLINAPLGCKFYYGFPSSQTMIRESHLWNLRGELRLSNAMDDRLLRSQYFAGTPQVPGTNLRYEDYIFGTREQLHRALNDIFTERRYSFFAVIQGPGTSLLGEALEEELAEISEEFGIPYLFVESPGLSSNSFLGWDDTAAKLLQKLLPEHSPVPEPAAGKRRPRVNLFGFHTYSKYMEGDVAEITRLLDLCGIDVNCAFLAGCRIEELRRIPDADLNLLFSPERCQAVGRTLRDMDLPVLDLGGMPLGFDLTEQFLRKVSKALGTDCSPALEDVERGKARAFYFLARTLGSAGFPKDLRYAAEGEWSLLRGYADYLSGYLGIRPEALHPLYTQCEGTGREELRALLRSLNAEEALDREIAEVKDVILLAGGNTILEVTAYSGNVYGIETAGPSLGYIDVVPKTHLGTSGALLLLEQILNGMKLLNAWK